MIPNMMQMTRTQKLYSDVNVDSDAKYMTYATRENEMVSTVE